MWRIGLLALLATIASGQSRYLSNIQQLTDGGQNAEAYWSPDGTKLVFQSTRDGNECDQIYVMNADGSDMKMVSTGKGVTTCGYFMPDGEGIIYASTHGAAPGCPPRPDRSKGYVWPVHAGYDLYLTTTAGGEPKQLTNSAGYDAEATVNWKTGQIVYTSMAKGDLDLWVMDVKGGRKTRLTTAEGYDGGAFFSPNGQHLVWRANHPVGGADLENYRDLLRRNLTTPMKMELYIADGYGMSVKRITNTGCASFAPQFTPDGQHIIFASNMDNCDSREFELFMVDLDGNNLEKITRFGGFTSFPEFSPDGKKLVFTSSWKAKTRYEFNIFVADWTGN